MATGGAVIGFNNFWQFPELVTGQGGSAFLILYGLGLVLIGLPLLLAQIALGRRGLPSPVHGFLRLAAVHRADPNWRWLGWLIIISSLLILASLSVMGGWAQAYLMRAATGALNGLTAEALGNVFTQLVNDPEKQLFWFTLFIGLTVAISAAGVRDGLERFARWAVPAVLAILAGLLLYAGAAGDLATALDKVLVPDFTRLTAGSLQQILAHVFFSLSLGVGFVFCLGAYAPDSVLPSRAALGIVAIDVGVSVLAALVITAVLAGGEVEAVSGPGLFFQALPLAFDHLPAGQPSLSAFFVMIVLVALLAAVAMLEPFVAWLSERLDQTRARVVLLAGGVVWVLGLVMMLSFSAWRFSFPFFAEVKKFGLFDMAQILTTQVLLPVAGLLMAVMAGWIMRAEEMRDTLALRTPCSFDIWLWLTRLFVPLYLLFLLFSLPGLLA
jgi:NSS family neurotransmitter:Na+ symporter